MDIIMNLLFSSVAVIGGADGPTAVAVSGDLPIPAIVVSAFAVLFVAYVYIMKAINSKKAPAVTEEAKPTQAAAPVQSSQSRDSVLLENVDEKTAAVIMAIVSEKSGIPLERLAFSSIKLMEDK